MSKRPKDNRVGPWAIEKLDSLKRGLDYWTTYLKNQPYWQKVYVDAFAGPGLSVVRTRPKDDKTAGIGDLFAPREPAKVADPVDQEERYLKGSPRVALDLKNPFDRYIFIEKDPKRRDELEAMKAEYGDTRNIDIYLGDANEVLLQLLRGGFTGPHLPRSVRYSGPLVHHGGTCRNQGRRGDDQLPDGHGHPADDAAFR